MSQDQAFDCGGNGLYSFGDSTKKCWWSRPVNPNSTNLPKNGEGGSSGAPQPPPTKEVSQQQIRSMLADAAQILHQATLPTAPPGRVPAVPVRMSAPCTPPAFTPGPVSPQHQSGASVTPGRRSHSLH